MEKPSSAAQRGGLGLDPDIGGGGDVRAGAQILCETLAPFQLRGGGRGSEGGDAGGAQGIGDPGDERGLGTDDDQVDGLGVGQSDDGFDIAGVDRMAGRPARDPGIAGGGDQRGAAWRLRKPLRERIFAAPRPEQQELHERFRFWPD